MAPSQAAASTWALPSSRQRGQSGEAAAAEAAPPNKVLRAGAKAAKKDEAPASQANQQSNTGKKGGRRRPQQAEGEDEFEPNQIDYILTNIPGRCSMDSRIHQPCATVADHEAVYATFIGKLWRKIRKIITNKSTPPLNWSQRDPSYHSQSDNL